MLRPTAGPPHGPSPIVPPPDRPCEQAAVAPRAAPPTRGASTCNTHPAGLAARHQAPVVPVGTRRHPGFLCLTTTYNVQRHGLDVARGYFFHAHAKGPVGWWYAARVKATPSGYLFNNPWHG
jgi:hypothetical protein